MSTNNLFIGLGGQGVKSIAALRRINVTRSSQYKELIDPDDGVPKAKFSYLAIDSDIPVEMNLWRTMGKDVRLDASQKVNIESSGLQASPATLAAQTNISPWIGDPKFISNVLRGGSIPGAGQKRRFGRLLGAAKGGVIVNAIDNAVLGFGGGTGAVENSCAFHIFATLGGGTGSGTIVDVVGYLRERYRDTMHYPIYLYIYITSQHVSVPDAGFFYENQYAALRDLSALNVGDYRPHLAMLNGTTARLDQKATANAINQIIVSCDQAGSCGEGAYTNTVNIDSQIQHMAEICFERVYALETGNFTQAMKKAITGEDVVESNPYEPNESFPERSYRFSVAGMKRWMVPVTEVKENLYYFLYAQILNRWQYQHWAEGKGYCKSISSEATLASKFYEILTVAMVHNPITEAQEAYERAVTVAAKEILSRYKKEGLQPAALQKFAMELSNIWEKGSVQNVMALSSFLDIQTQQIALLCKEIRQTILNLTVDAACSGGLVNLEASLRQVMKDFAQQADEERERENKEQEIQKRLKRHLNNRDAEQWVKITLLSSAVGKTSSLLEAHSEDSLALFKSKLREGMRKGLLDLYEEVSQMLRSLTHFAANAVKNTHAWEQEISKKLAASTAALQALQNSVVVKYDFDYSNLQGIINEILRVRKRFDKEVLIFDAMWREHAGDIVTFVSNDTALSKLREDMENESKKNSNTVWVSSERLHNQVVQDDPDLESVLYGSLVDRLEKRHKSNPSKLQADIDSFMASVLTSAKITPSEGIETTITDPAPFCCMSLGIPNEGEFRQSLLEKLENAIPASLKPKTGRYSSYGHSCEYEICIMYVQYWMPIRFVDALQYLEQRYNAILKDPEKLYFVNIDFSGQKGNRPNLMYDVETIRKEFPHRAYWQSHLLSCGDPDNTPIITQEVDSTGRELIIKHTYTPGRMGTAPRYLNLLDDNRTIISEAEYLVNVPMSDINEICKDVRSSLQRMVDSPDHFVHAKELQEQAGIAVRAMKNPQKRAMYEQSYNYLMDDLEKRALLILH